MPHPRFHLDEKKEKSGFHSLNLQEQTAWLIDQYNYQLSLGGLSMFEEYGDLEHLPIMVEALHRINAPHSAKQLQNLCAMYGPEGITSSAIRKKDASEEAHQAWIEKIETLSKEDIFEDTNFLVLKFVLDHKECFEILTERNF